MQCNICSKDLSSQNDHNRERHIAACREKKRKRELASCQQPSVLSFYLKQNSGLVGKKIHVFNEYFTVYNCVKF